MIARPVDIADRAARGQALLADFLAQGFVVHVDALTLARSTMTQIVRRGLVTQKDGSPIRTIGVRLPQKGGFYGTIGCQFRLQAPRSGIFGAISPLKGGNV